MPSQVGHAGLEGVAGAQGGLFKDHGQRLPGQQGPVAAGLPLGFEFLRPPEEVEDFLPLQVGHADQVTSLEHRRLLFFVTEPGPSFPAQGVRRLFPSILHKNRLCK